MGAGKLTLFTQGTRELHESIMRASRIASCIGLVALMAGCANLNEMGTGGKTAVGAGAGAALGAGLGALIGDSSKAALIGGGIGAIAGGIAGYNWAGVKNDVGKSGAKGLGVDVTEMPDGTCGGPSQNVSFDTGKYALKPALLPVLDSVGRALVQHPNCAPSPSAIRIARVPPQRTRRCRSTARAPWRIT